MSELPALAHVMTSAVGLMGAAVAGLSVYFTYRGRHNQFRQAVYGRQMDAYFDIAESMSDLFTCARNALDLASPCLGGEGARARFRTAVREGHERFTATVNRSLIVLPSRVKAAMDNFNRTLLEAGEPSGEQPEGPGEPGEAMARAYERAINSIRHHLAVDSLTSGMLDEMGIGSESVMMKGFRSGLNPLVPVGRSNP
jgi:hypothetical protein